MSPVKTKTYNSFEEMTDEEFVTIHVLLSKSTLVEGHNNPKQAKRFIGIVEDRLERLMSRGFANPEKFVNGVIADLQTRGITSDEETIPGHRD